MRTVTKEKLKDWYPSVHQLKTPEDHERAFRETLRQFYALREKVNAQVDQPVNGEKSNSSPFPPGSGPSDSFIGGIPVEPFDVNSLNDGDTLQYDKANRRFVIKT